MDLEFLSDDGSVISTLFGRVVHSRPASVPGERTAGMGIEVEQLDAFARSVVEAYERGTPSKRESPPPSSTGAESSPPGRSAAVDQPKSKSQVPYDSGFNADPAAARLPLLSMSGPVVGVDVGTSTSSVAYVADGAARILRSSHGWDSIPSVVFFEGDKRIVGPAAVQKMVLAPHSAVYGSKRFLGRPYRCREVLSLGHFFHYDLVEGSDGYAAASVGGRVVRLVDVAADILRALRETASEQLGCDVRRAVITVPAYFGESQRRAVRQAGKLAGFFVERVINEPTAAALAYSYGRDLHHTLLIYDLGGGTFDVSVVRVEGDTLEVLATDGDPFLGGVDFDDRLTEYALTLFQRSMGLDARADAVAVQRVRFAVEAAKKQLSEVEEAGVDLPYLVQGKDGSVDMHMRIERSVFESLTQDLVDRTLTIVDSVLRSARLTTHALDDVVLVGSQTHSQHVRRTLKQRFGDKLSGGVHPGEAVALGAAMVAAMLHERNPIKLVELG